MKKNIYIRINSLKLYYIHSSWLKLFKFLLISLYLFVFLYLFENKLKHTNEIIDFIERCFVVF